MKLKEMIKVMEHYEKGNIIQVCNFGSHNYSDITTKDYLFNFCDYKYRIKEQKQKVTIEKWLCVSSGVYVIIEASNIYNCYDCEPVKLLETYEVEI